MVILEWISKRYYREAKAEQCKHKFGKPSFETKVGTKEVQSEA